MINPSLDSFTFLEKLEHEKENTEGNKNDPFHKWIQLKSTREKLLTKLEHLERTEVNHTINIKDFVFKKNPKTLSIDLSLITILQDLVI